MKLESERVPETAATPELAAELLRDAARRGAWLVAKDDADDGRFVQAGESGDGFFLEWRDGSAAPLRRTARPVAAAEAESAFRAFLSGDTDWTARFDWTDSAGAPVAAFRVTRRGVLVFLAAFAAAVVGADLAIRLLVCFSRGFHPLSEVFDPLVWFKYFAHSVSKGELLEFVAALAYALVPVSLLAAAVCTVVCKKPRKAILFAALFSFLAEAAWLALLSSGSYY